MVAEDTLFLQYLLDFIADGFELALRIAAAQDKVIGKAAYPLRIEQDDIRRLLVTCGFDCLAGYCQWFQYSDLRGYNYII